MALAGLYGEHAVVMALASVLCRAGHSSDIVQAVDVLADEVRLANA